MKIKINKMKKRLNFKKIELENNDYNTLAKKVQNIIGWEIVRSSNMLKQLYYDEVIKDLAHNQDIINNSIKHGIDKEDWMQGILEVARGKVKLYNSYFILLEITEENEKKGEM